MLIIYFYNSNLYWKLHWRVIALLNSLKNLITSHRNNSFVWPVSHHRVWFARSGLPICEQTCMISFSCIIQYTYSHIIKHYLLISIFWWYCYRNSLFHSKTIMRPITIIEEKGFFNFLLPGKYSCHIPLHFYTQNSSLCFFFFVKWPNPYSYFNATICHFR